MPLHLLGKKSWNVYNADNIARVKADEAAAAAREAADEQRMQELDAERRAAILRGRTPPPLPESTTSDGRGQRRARDEGGRERKRRKLAGEDDTDMDIRLASKALPKTEEYNEAKILKLRSTLSDAPLTDHAGHIDLFPVDMKEAIKREKNAEVEKEKRKKEKALEDQYTMRLSNAAGKGGISQPWYTADQKSAPTAGKDQELTAYSGFEEKDVWGNEDPRRKERQQARISTSDPFALMQKAQAQLQRSKLDKKKWAEERDRELRELRATQERHRRVGIEIAVVAGAMIVIARSVSIGIHIIEKANEVVVATEADVIQMCIRLHGGIDNLADETSLIDRVSTMQDSLAC
ncbi:hypothetical protein LEMA_P007360.1 [Plenodomus lingam JN3]|uniref:CBF1-interacting co-repressor CIR N-terminal domain-containing protein n=1 Tax=Leptosphaeria maculans (strain JN3 / isolate v23.1.3 / race Av1-4-5-6-7-8) TaxID=985895 RepID=E5AFG0_LEPMJ|nr:hypothetical protein LEMA_P007360.1 [Plenodomus lingam JN3]CBY01949.1 hypothetical protein LEMA_P007360.1 [Plenodomus lingam JN3]